MINMIKGFTGLRSLFPVACSLMFLLSCSEDFERNNMYDPKLSNYIWDNLSSSSVETDNYPFSSSSFNSGSAPSSNSGGTQISSSTIPSSSSKAQQTVKIEGTPITYQGKTYKTVQIGSQIWMAENLNYNASGSVCYNNLESNCNTYGRLYNWSTAMGLDATCNSNSCASSVQTKHQGICPAGWHIPSDDDWDKLMTAVGGPSTAGTKLKATSGWDSGNGSDDYGFSALPGGLGYSTGYFYVAGSRGFWWSSSEYDAYRAYYRNMYYNTEYAYWYDGSKTDLQSVRCLQD